MSKKGSITTSNYIDYDKALNKGKSLLGTKDEKIGFYIITSINVGLRIGDILDLTFEDFERGHKTFREQKTNKAKTVLFNETILKAFKTLNKKSVPYVFTSQKGQVYSRQQVNRKLKQYFSTKDKNVSSHSLRKTFGRRVYENNNQSEHSLLLLNDIYNHTSIAQTREYLDIRQEEIENIYLTL